MRTKFILAALLMMASSPVIAGDPHKDEHGGQIFHMFRLEADTGTGSGDTISTWDFDGWVGTDENKLHLKSEGEAEDGDVHDAEFWAMYSRNIDTFWDAQVGVRYDSEPRSTSYLVAGFEGLAPQFFEMEAHVFVSADGDISVRLRQEKDFLLTQRLIVQPYLEANLFVQNVPELEKGSGLSDGEVGVQLRYEITRKFAPYVDVRYERKFGNTASIAIAGGEDRDAVIGSVGIRLMF